MLEIGPKGKKAAAVAPDWPGLSRGAKTGDDAVKRLLAYVPRYAPVAKLAGMESEFAPLTKPGLESDLVEQYLGTGSTDFWGISFTFSSLDKQPVSDEELDRQLALLWGCWRFFDAVRSRVSAELQKGPRGGGRDRDRIVRHVIGNEWEWARKLGINTPLDELLADESRTKIPDFPFEPYRQEFVEAVRALHAEGKMARTWPLLYLIRHTAFHVLDHSWEMEDKDLSGKL